MQKNILLFLFLLSSVCYAQIVELNSISKKKEGLKDTSVEVFYEATSYLVERDLSLNPFYTNTELGEKINETSRRLFSHQLGIRVPITKIVSVDAGISWIQNGENYSYENQQSDSTFSYTSCYRYFGLPVNIMASVPLNPKNEGTLISVFIRGGGIPHLYQSFLQKTEWTTTLGSKKSEKIKSMDNPSSFMFSGHISSGLDLLSKTKWGLRIAIHYRYSLTNTFTKYGDYIHKPYGMGYSLSLTKKL
ncbi:MAG: hypothetical protein ACKO00_06905 [Crocinitomicaceae bacterium]